MIGTSTAVRGELMRGIAVTAAALALATAGCASSGGQGGSGGGGTAVGTPPRKIELGMSATGRTVTAHLNDVIEVRLGSTYWRFHPVTGGVLSRGKLVTHAPSGPVRIPGTGRGTVIATYRVLKSGTARVSASRTTCGEAMRCSGAQSSFALTVVAS
jgi:hypothetical protein